MLEVWLHIPKAVGEMVLQMCFWMGIKAPLSAAMTSEKLQ